MTARIGVLACRVTFANTCGCCIRRTAGCRRPVRSAPADLAAVSGLVIPGGESTTIGMLIRRNDLEEPLRAALQGRFAGPGHLRGHDPAGPRGAPDDRSSQPGSDRHDSHRGATPSGGRSTPSRPRCPCPRLAGPPVTAVFIRAPWVERVGPDVEVLATVETRTTRIQSSPFGRGKAVATSFHPEMTDDRRFHTRRWSRWFGGSMERPFQMGDNQAQEGGDRRQTRQAVRETHQEHRGRCTHWWR